MRITAAFLLIALSILSCSSCARIRIIRNSEILGAPESVHRKTFHTVAFGAETLTGPLELASRCPNGWQTILSESPFPQLLFNTLTVNLYGQWTAEVACLAPKAAPKED